MARIFPEYHGEPLAWSLGLYFTPDEAKENYPRMRAVIQAFRCHIPGRLEREYRTKLIESSDRLFREKAIQIMKILDEEQSKEITYVPLIEID